MRNSLKCVRDAVGVVIHRIDFPARTGAMMTGVADPVQRGVAQINVRCCHVDFRAQHMFPFRELTRGPRGEECCNSEFFRRSAPTTERFFSRGRERGRRVATPRSLAAAADQATARVL